MRKVEQKLGTLLNGVKRASKLSLFIILLLSGSFWGCSEDESHINSRQKLSSRNLSSQVKSKGSEMTFYDLFEKIAQNDLKVKRGNVLYIYYTINKYGTINILNVKESEPTWPIAFAMIGLFAEEKSQTEKNYIISGKDKYQVSCSTGWDKTCGGAYSCGTLVKKCLDSGGCAEVCELQMVYDPENKTFYLIGKE